MESEEEEKYCSNCKRSVAATNFAIHSAFCERNIFVCQICEEPVGITEKEEHFDNYHVISPCDLCEASIEKWMIPDHMKICPKRLIVCEYCEAEFPLNEHTEHVEFCGSRTEKCLLCKKYIMMKDKDKHSELHRQEQKYNRKKIQEEIMQNKVNEEISSLDSSAVEKANSDHSKRREETGKEEPKARIGDSYEGMKSGFNKTGYDSRLTEKDLGMQSLQGATVLPSRAKASPDTSIPKSSRYGECHICKQSIPWIDMNTHIPSCASLAGKCSVCGEDVPNHAMKEHMREHFSGNLQVRSDLVSERPHSSTSNSSSNHHQNNTCKTKPHFSDKHTDGSQSSSVDVYECQLCLALVPRKDRHRHETSDCQMLKDNESDGTYYSRSLSQNFIECSLCSAKVLEENLEKHLSFGCQKLLENNRSFDTSAMESESQVECPLCLAWMPEKDKKKHELFECKVLIESCGVAIPEPELDVNPTKKPCQCSHRKKKNNCGKCKCNPQNKMSDNSKYCQQRKVPCPHCKEMIDSSNLDVHEHYCQHKKSDKYSSKFEDVRNFKASSQIHKGAIPKNTNIREMMRPTAGKCKYCHTSLNMDILKYHEEECIHQPIECPQCQNSIPMKDLKDHECKKEKKDKHKGGQQNPEEKSNSNFSMFKSAWEYLKPSSFKEKATLGEKETTNSQNFYPYTQYSYSSYGRVSDFRGSDPPLYFSAADFMVPCEFCNKEVLASELVLHETGCNPDLVCYAKQEPSESPNLNETSAKHDTVPTNTQFKQTKVESKEQPFFPGNSTSTSDRIKHERKLNTKPGEFLQHEYEKSSSREYVRTGNVLKGRKEENDSFQSVWNTGSYVNNENEECPDQISKHLEDPMDVDELNESNTVNARIMKHERESTRQTSEDGDMNAYFTFLNVDKNNESDKEYEKESDRYEKKFLSTKVASNPAFDSNLLQKNFKDYSDERNSNIEGESSRLLRENMRSVGNNGGEFSAAIQQLKDLQSDASIALTYKQIPSERNTLEKKDEEPEISSKQKNLLDASAESNKELHKDFKKYLPELKFASPKEKFSNTVGDNKAFFAKNDERCENLCDKHISKTSVDDRLSSHEEYADSLKNETDSKYARYHSSASYEKNVCKTKEDEKLKRQSHKNISGHPDYGRDYIKDLEERISDLKLSTHEKLDSVQEFNRLLAEKNEEKYNETRRNYITEMSKHVLSAEGHGKFASDSYNLTDSEIAHLKSERRSLKNADHETFPPKNVVYEPVVSSLRKTSGNTSSENECISNYKKHFPDFKFATSQKSTIAKEEIVHHAVTSEKNLTGATKKLYEQQLSKISSKHSDFSGNEKESGNSFSPLANFQFASFQSATSEDETFQREIGKTKDVESNKLQINEVANFKDKMSRNEMECSGDFRKYLPDFKFGSQITKYSKDKTSIETESRAKWNEWRKSPKSDDSDSE